MWQKDDTNSDDMGNTPNDLKARRIWALIEDVRASRAAGREVSDETVTGAYPDLMPELLEELMKLRRIEAARAAMEGMPGDQTSCPPNSSPDPSIGGTAADEDLPPRITIRAPGYSILREISRGGQAVVYQAMQLSTGRKVALKIMRDGPLASQRAVARFKREVGVLAALNHPNIVTIFDTGQTEDGSWYLAMDYIGGCSLDEYIKERQKKQDQDPSWLLRLFLKICAAVSAAHLRGVVHRDLKPSNIRIDNRGEPHILDFGLARTALDVIAQNGNAPLSITGEFLGSLPWSSPEQAEGDPDKIDIRTDVYSLGVILYQMITGGRFPYEVVGNIRDILNNILTVEPTPPSKVIAAAKDHRTVPMRLPLVNEAIEKIVLKALAKKREKRYQSAGEMGRDIAQYLSGRQTNAPSPTKESLPIQSGGQRVLLRWASVAVAICVVVCGGIYARHFIHREKIVPMISRQETKVRAQAAAISQIPTGRHINLLSLVDLSQDGLVGRWTAANNGAVVCGSGRSYLEFPYLPPAEYDYRVTFQRLDGNEDITMVGAGSGIRFGWAIGALGNTVCGITLVGGKKVDENPSTNKADHWITNGQRYTALVQVRKDGIKAYLDGKLVSTLETNYRNLHFNSRASVMTKSHPGMIGIQLWQDPYEIESAEIIEITGEGKLLRPSVAGGPNQSAAAAPPDIPTKATTSATTDTTALRSTAPVVKQPAQMPADAALFNAHHFKLFPDQLTWDQAAARCKQMGGHLASPKDADAMTFLQKLKGDSTIAWIGGSADAFGNWNWQDGTLIPAEQVSIDPQHPEYHWIFLSSRGKLSTRPQDGHIDGAAYPDVQGFICEWDQ